MNCFSIQKNQNFNIAQIFDCGQCFRFNKTDDGSYEGVAFDKYIKVTECENKVTFYNVTEEEYKSVWHSFFDMETDYEGIMKGFADDRLLSEAALYSKGIRILKQDKWEALCSFIISQNNNIPRIKGIIERMSEKYGREIYRDNGKSYYSFPTAESLYNAGENEIFSMKTGFRAKYIFDAAKTVCERPTFLDEVSALDTKAAAEKLCSIKGVGPKVAACTLLFGFSRYDSFPVDVWVKRVLEKYYPDGITGHLAGKHAGIAQQYLFYYERCMNDVFLNK